MAQIKILFFDDTEKLIRESGIIPDLIDQAGKVMAVKSDESGLEAIDAPSGGGGGVGESLYFYTNYPGGL